MSTQGIKNWFDNADTITVSTDHLISISQHFNCSLDWLISGNGGPSTPQPDYEQPGDNLPSKRAALTDWQVADAKRLRAAFHEAQKQWPTTHGKKLTQDIFGELVGGMTQESVGHYINARIPLNIEFLLKACAILRVEPSNISPTLAAQIGAPPDSAIISIREPLRQALRLVLSTDAAKFFGYQSDIIADATLEVALLLAKGDHVTPSIANTITKMARRIGTENA